VDNDVEVLLGGVFRDVGVGEFLGGGHCVERRDGGFFCRRKEWAMRGQLGVEGLGGVRRCRAGCKEML
jgi:hypothetical protein